MAVHPTAIQHCTDHTAPRRLGLRQGFEEKKKKKELSLEKVASQEWENFPSLPTDAPLL